VKALNKFFSSFLKAVPFFLSYLCFGIFLPLLFIFFAALTSTPFAEINEFVSSNRSAILFITNLLSVLFSLFIAKKTSFEAYPFTRPKTEFFVSFFVLGFLLNVFLSSIFHLMIKNGIFENELRSFIISSATVVRTGAFSFFVSVIFVPLCEEIIFRGFIFKAFTSFLELPLSAVLSAVLFASVHSGSVAISYAFVFGIVFALVCEKFGLVYSVMLHAGFNITGYIIVLEKFEPIPFAISIILILILSFFIFKKGKKDGTF